MKIFKINIGLAMLMDHSFEHISYFEISCPKDKLKEKLKYLVKLMEEFIEENGEEE